jgi:hypothetical protein
MERLPRMMGTVTALMENIKMENSYAIGDIERLDGMIPMRMMGDITTMLRAITAAAIKIEIEPTRGDGFNVRTTQNNDNRTATIENNEKVDGGLDADTLIKKKIHMHNVKKLYYIVSQI